MTSKTPIAANVARLRIDRGLNQAQLAEKAELSRMTLGRIERGAVVPRAAMLTALARALSISVGELVAPIRSLEQVRFRTGTRIRGREQILAEVSKRLDAYNRLEEALKEHRPFEFGNVSSFGKDLKQLARGARDAADCTDARMPAQGRPE